MVCSCGDDPKGIVLERHAGMVIRGGKWTSVPMSTVYGGDKVLYKDGYVLGLPGTWLFCAYLKFSPLDEGQGIVQFARDINGPLEDTTGANDWNFTSGRDFKSHTWPFSPILGTPTGFQVYSSYELQLEYAQLKAIRLL